jgi:hypothetical protein
MAAGCRFYLGGKGREGKGVAGRENYSLYVVGYKNASIKIQCKSSKWASTLNNKIAIIRIKTVILNCKNRFRFKTATLYEREVIKKAKFFFAGTSFRTHTTGG